MPRRKDINEAAQLLERRQQRARTALDEADAALARHHQHDIQELIDAAMVDASLGEAESGKRKAVAAMVRSDLETDPRVQVWVNAHRILGQGAFLRRTCKGLETGVRRPMKPDDVLLAAEVSKLTEGSSEERKPEGIRRRLVARLLSLATRKVEDPHIDRATAHRLHNRVHCMSREGWRKLLSALDD